MDISGIKSIVPYEIVESLTKRGLEKFTPPQEAAINSGLFEGSSIVVASPTASGKTLVAELAAAYSIMAKGKKAVYIAPMRALVEEKYSEFKASYPYIKSVMSIGDMDSNDPWLSNYSMIFVSTEKFDSLIRHGIDWLQSIGCIIFDEVHMLDDSSRGATLELLMTKLKSISDAQIIALSATIGNAKEIAEWLGAKLVESDYRPVKLKKGVVLNNVAYYRMGRRKKDEADAAEELSGVSQLQEIRIVEDTLRKGKQALIFYSSRRNAEAGAERVGNAIKGSLTIDERVRLEELSSKILGVLESPT
ncbi:MAG: DEAD/DEAH box helicase, partial [Candidatus Micrarchaeaceae archaeon]